MWVEWIENDEGIIDVEGIFCEDDGNLLGPIYIPVDDIITEDDEIVVGDDEDFEAEIVCFMDQIEGFHQVNGILFIFF
jgi:hypothetical protein